MGSLRNLLACFGRDAGSVVEGGGGKTGPTADSGARAQGQHDGCGECHIQDIRRMLRPIDLAQAAERPPLERPNDLQEALERNATPQPQGAVQPGMQLALEPTEGASAGARPWVWVPAAAFDEVQSPSRSPEDETACFFESLLESHRERQRHLNDTLDTGLSDILGDPDDLTCDYEDDNDHISASCVFADPGFGFLDGGAFQDDRELLDGGRISGGFLDQLPCLPATHERQATEWPRHVSLPPLTAPSALGDDFFPGLPQGFVALSDDLPRGPPVPHIKAAPPPVPAGAATAVRPTSAFASTSAAAHTTRPASAAFSTATSDPEAEAAQVDTQGNQHANPHGLVPAHHLQVYCPGPTCSRLLQPQSAALPSSSTFSMCGSPLDLLNDMRDLQCAQTPKQRGGTGLWTGRWSGREVAVKLASCRPAPAQLVKCAQQPGGWKALRQGSAGSSALTAATGCWPEQPAVQTLTPPTDSQQHQQEGKKQEPLKGHQGQAQKQQKQEQEQGQAADVSHTSHVRSCCTDALDHLMCTSVELSSCSSTTAISLSGGHARDGSCTDAAAAAVTNTGLRRPPPPDCGVVAMEAAARLAHPNLVPVHVVRAVLLDEQGLAELDPVPTLRPGWGVEGRRPPSRLASYLSAHHMAASPVAAVACAADGAQDTGYGAGAVDTSGVLRPPLTTCPFASLTVYPSDFLPPPPPSPAVLALQSLQLRPGSLVWAVVMEHCDMGDLQALSCAVQSPFHANRCWPLYMAQRALLRTAREVAAALWRLHERGVTHGAVKPTNVLVSKSPVDRRGFTARVTDVGFASVPRASDNPMAAGPAMLLLAPEVLANGPAAATPASDVYGFGMVLYVMAVGEMPYSDMRPAPALAAIATQQLRPEWPTGQHNHLQPLYERCLAHVPSDRPTLYQVLCEIRAMERTVKVTRRRGTVGQQVDTFC